MNRPKHFAMPAGILLLLLLLQACPMKPYEADIYFNHIQINLLNNTGERPQYTESDSLFASAIAFAASLSDTSGYNTKTSPKTVSINTNFSLIKKAHAWSVDEYFYIQQDITGIKIQTLYDLDENTPAGSDVSSLFYFSHAGKHNILGYDLYFTREELMESINAMEYLETYTLGIQFFLKEEVEQDMAAFSISISLSDGTLLETNTPDIHIIKSN